MIKKIAAVTGVMFGIAGAYLFAVKPSVKRKKRIMSLFKQKYIAHRGLFNNPNIPENSMKAFEEAVKKGYGIELDLQLSADDKVIVFHDDSLKRMCNDPRMARDLTYEELYKLTLAGSSERIPLFKDVLSLVKGRVPLLVEIKPEGRSRLTAKKAAELLEGYKGAYCMQSFNPFVLMWYRINRPKLLRGQLSTDLKREGDPHSAPGQFILTYMLFNFLSKPDFISYDIKYTANLSFKVCSKLFKSLNAGWTIQDKEQLSRAKRDFDIFIFDSFNP